MQTSASPITKEQIAAYIATVRAIADSIKELGQVPAGHIYAVVMGQMSLEAFNRIISQLVGAGVIEHQPSGLLVWKGAK